MVKPLNSDVIESVLYYKNEYKTTLKLHLEPSGQEFEIQPGHEVEIHSIFKRHSGRDSFAVHAGDGYIAVFVPGGFPSGLIDYFVISGGIKLVHVNRL
jgi:hypothetical protein